MAGECLPTLVRCGMVVCSVSSPTTTRLGSSELSRKHALLVQKTSTFVNSVLSGGRDLAAFAPDHKLYHNARTIALKSIPTALDEPRPRTITLASAYGNVGASIGSKMTWQAWERLLNPEQRKFADTNFDSNSPSRERRYREDFNPGS